jgi:hypothetical protein
MQYLVVIGNAQTGLAFVGPFDSEASADAYIAQWKATTAKATPIGHVVLEPVTNFNVGRNL